MAAMRDLGFFMENGKQRECDQVFQYVHITPLKHILAHFDPPLSSPSSRCPLSDSIIPTLAFRQCRSIPNPVPEEMWLKHTRVHSYPLLEEYGKQKSTTRNYHLSRLFHSTVGAEWDKIKMIHEALRV
jgi:hypothetical protein